MELCPVCETPHPSAALECSICGHVFRQAAVDASIVPLADLEATRSVDSPVSVETAPGLEPTRFEAGVTLPSIPMEGLEPTLVDFQAVGAETTPDLEPTRLAEEELPSIFPADVTCPNCGEVGEEEQAFCNRCGMQLPRTRPAATEALPEAVCTSCGGTSFAGGACRRCGVRQSQAV